MIEVMLEKILLNTAGGTIKRHGPEIGMQSKPKISCFGESAKKHLFGLLAVSALYIMTGLIVIWNRKNIN